MQYDASLLLTPGDPIDLLNLGDALVAQARFEIWTGADPSDTIREALERLGAAAESRPEYGLIYTTMSGACLIGAMSDLEKRGSPRASLENARAFAEKGLALDATAGSSFRRVHYHHLGDLAPWATFSDQGCQRNETLMSSGSVAMRRMVERAMGRAGIETMVGGMDLGMARVLFLEVW
ncbi:MAG: hypothetical protein HYX75_11120 [Acidobacteria bacterium]|nr:hypothetical protein [Acidobacteriota bacterium]